MPVRLDELIQETQPKQPNKSVRLDDLLASKPVRLDELTGQASAPQEISESPSATPRGEGGLSSIPKQIALGASEGLPASIKSLALSATGNLPFVPQTIAKNLRVPRPIEEAQKVQPQGFGQKAGRVGGRIAAELPAVVIGSKGLNAVIPGLGKLAAGNLAQKSAALGVEGAAISGGFAAERGASPKDIAIETATGGAITGALPGAGRLGKLALETKAGQAVAKPVKQAAQKVGNILFGKKLQKSKIGSSTEKAQTQITDEFAPVAHLVDDFERAVGRKALPSENVFEGARNFSGLPGRLEYRSRVLEKIIKPVVDQRDDLSQVLISRRNEELLAQGRGLAQGAKIKLASGKVVPVQTLDEIGQRIGPERLKQLQDVSEQMTQFNNEILLADAVDSGVVSKASAAAMKARNENFTPFKALETIADDLLDDSGVRFGRQSFQVAKQDAFKTLEGGAKVLDDPLMEQARRIFKVSALSERNRVAKSLMDMIKADPDKTNPFIRLMGKKVRPDKGFSEFTFFEDGKAVKLEIPTPVADAVKGMNQQAIDYVTRFASVASNALRAGATTFSLAFGATNPIRDAQLVRLTAKAAGVPFNPKTWVRGLFSAIKRDKLFDEFENELASFGGFFRGTNIVGPNVSPKKLLRQIAPTRTQRTIAKANAIVNPATWIRKVGEVLELAPRIAIFNEAKKQGLPARSRSFLSRNSSIDFSRRGTAMRIANMFIPFLNARTQGTINFFKAVKKNPLGASAVIASDIALPATMLYWWNTRNHPEVWNQLAQFEKDKYFIMILGDEVDADNQRYTQVLKIIKGDVGRIVANPLENALAFVDGRDNKALDELALEIASDLSPIPFERDGQLSLQRAGSAVLPPPLKAAGVLSDPEAKSLFTGFPVVPRRVQNASPKNRFRRTTSETLKMIARTKVGQALRVSPAQTEAALGEMFGGAARDVLGILDVIVTGKTPKKGLPVIGGVTRRFSGARGGQQRERDFARLEELESQSADQSFERREFAEAVVEGLKQNSDPKRQLEILQSAQREDPKVIASVKRILQDEARGVDSFDRKLKTLPPNLRAQFIQEKLDAVQTLQQRQAILQDFVKKRILTKETQAALAKLRTQKATAAPRVLGRTRRLEQIQ